MNIDILYIESCPNYPRAIAMVNDLVKELGIDADIQEVLVRGPEEARNLHFLGSPSIQVDFVDIEPGASERTDFSYATRSYNGEALPSRGLLVAALTGDGVDSGADSGDVVTEKPVATSGYEPKMLPTPICPGCLSSLVRLGMHQSTGVAHNYAGREYYFCSRGCVDVFERDAERYLLELNDLIVCPVCLGERYQRSATYVAVEGSVYFTCRSPKCGELLREDPDFYIRRLAGKESSAGVKDHDGCRL